MISLSQFSLLTLKICFKMGHLFLNHITEGHPGLDFLTIGDKAEGPDTQKWTDGIYIHLQMRSVFKCFGVLQGIPCYFVHWEVFEVNFSFHKALIILSLWKFASFYHILKGTFVLIHGVCCSCLALEHRDDLYRFLTSICCSTQKETFYHS